MSSIVANVLLRLTLAPDVTASTDEDRKQLIDTYIRGFIVGAKAPVGVNHYITAKNFTVEITNGMSVVQEFCKMKLSQILRVTFPCENVIVIIMSQATLYED